MNAADNSGSDLPVVPQIVAGSAPDPRAIQAVGSTSLTAGADSALETASGLSGSDLWRAFRRRWFMACSLGLLGAVVAGTLTWFIMPRPQYTATATLEVKAEVPRVIFPTSEAHTQFDTFQRTQRTMITSRYLLNTVLQDSRLAGIATISRVTEGGDEAVEWLQKQITVDFPSSSEILQISVNGESPADIQALANVITDTYMLEVVGQARAQRVSRLEQLKTLWKEYQDTMERKRGALRKLAMKAGSDNRSVLAAKSQLAYQQLAMIQQEKLRVKAEKIRLRAEAEAERDFKASEMLLRSMDLADSVTDETAIAEAVEKDPGVARLQETLRTLLQRYDRYLRIVKKSSDPSLIDLRKQIEEVSKELESTREEIRHHIRSQVSEQGQIARTGVPGTLRGPEQIQILEKFEKELEVEEQALRDKLDESNEDALDLEREKEEISLTDISAKKVGAEVEAMQVELGAPKRIRVIDYASKPTSRNNKKVVQATGLASLGALASILFGVSYLEVRTRRINCMDQVVHSLGLRVVGSLPAPPIRSRLPSLISARGKQQDWTKLVTASIDAIRAMLLYAARVQGLRVIMITSAQPSEGKTTLAGHLAASLARAGRRTALMDCDFRRPSLHRVFDLIAPSGLAEVLRGETSLTDIVYPATPNLSIIPAGQMDEARAMEALGRGDLQVYIDELKSQYDFIIIDSAPVLPVADSLLISQHVDAVILSVLHDVSRVPSVQETYNRLAALGVQIIGAVVAGAQEQNHYGMGYSDYRAYSGNEEAAKIS